MTVPASAPLDPPDPVAAVARRRRLRPVTPVPWRRPLALTGVGVIGAWVVIAIFAPLIAPDNPLAQKFAILGVPTVIFLDAAGQERKDLRLVGFEEADAFLKRLEKAP